MIIQKETLKAPINGALQRDLWVKFLSPLHYFIQYDKQMSSEQNKYLVKLKWEEANVTFRCFSMSWGNTSTTLKLVYSACKVNLRCPCSKRESDVFADHWMDQRQGAKMAQWEPWLLGAYWWEVEGGGGQRGVNMPSVVPEPAESMADTGIM